MLLLANPGLPPEGSRATLSAVMRGSRACSAAIGLVFIAVYSCSRERNLDELCAGVSGYLAPHSTQQQQQQQLPAPGEASMAILQVRQ